MYIQGEWNIDDALQCGEGLDPSPGNRTYSDVDEVLESEHIDEEIEEMIQKENIAREERKSKRFSFFRRKKSNDS